MTVTSSFTVLVVRIVSWHVCVTKTKSLRARTASTTQLLLVLLLLLTNLHELAWLLRSLKAAKELFLN